MWKWFKRGFFNWWGEFADYLLGKDSCELCGNEHADQTCVGCDRRICMLCDSGYYENENLCRECRKDITPEEEEQDRLEALASEEVG